MTTTSAAYMKKAAVVQTIARITVPCEGAERVLAVGASAAVRVSEVLNGEVRLSGREAAEIVVAGEDGIKKAEGRAEISDRAAVDGVSPQTRAVAFCRVTDTDIVSVGGGTVELASVVEITVMTEAEFTLPPPPEQTDGVYTDGETVRFSRLSARISGRLESGESERLPFTEIVCCNAGFVSDAPDASLDAVFFGGRFVLDGAGKRRDGSISPFTVELSVTGEIAAEGVRRGDTAFMRAGAPVVTESAGEDGISLAASVDVWGEAYCEMSASVVTDAFSPSRALTTETFESEGRIVRGSFVAEGRAEGAASLPEGSNADRITASHGFSATAVSAYAENGRAVVEGAVSGYVIYSDAEAGRRDSCCAEIPFKTVTDIPAEDGDELQADVSVCSVSARPSRSGEISVSCTLSLRVLVCGKVRARCVTSVTPGEEKEDKRGVLSMHSASEGESLWECAKALSVPPETVLTQNPDAVFPLRRGDKIFVFRSAGAANA